MNINQYGFIRVAAASPKLRVADCDYNTGEIRAVIERAAAENVQLICFPELCITGYTCADLFLQTALQKKAIASLFQLRDFLADKRTITAIVGLPLFHRNGLYNVAAVLSAGEILGFIPKKNIPNYNEFYEKRWFRSGREIGNDVVEIEGECVDFLADDALFQTPWGNFGMEICEDLWTPVPPSSALAMKGADIIFNLSASNELVGKNSYRASLIAQQSARCLSAYVYASAGCGESTTDLVFSGACFIAENGKIVQKSERFSLENELIISDIDVLSLRNDRARQNTFCSPKSGRAIEIQTKNAPVSFSNMHRAFNPHPFIPSQENREENLNDVFSIQTHGLAKRLAHTRITAAVIGISGGLDSTLALLVTLKAFDLLGIPRARIFGITMPGFGTTDRTYNNAVQLVKSSGATLKEISIVAAVNQHFADIGHDSSVRDITYENSQARERTQILMDYANKVNGLVIGTGNLSELALGWATYNGDHMSMYAVNASVPKTLVKSLVRWIADTRMDAAPRKILHDILDTPFSPELLPADTHGNIAQITEDNVGPYELHDFFLHRMLRHGDNPRRILWIARQAFAQKYDADTVLKWLRVFYKRFFAQQFKRSCMPDGPKVGSINLSPRGDWRMPSDAVAKVWMEELETEPRTKTED